MRSNPLTWLYMIIYANIFNNNCFLSKSDLIIASCDDVSNIVLDIQNMPWIHPPLILKILNFLKLLFT